MLYTLVIALVVVSGFIAYFGDLLGRRMGKKRLTLLRLRPKHTAIIVTTITGMLISVLVLTTLLTVDSGLREMLTQGKEIIRQNNNYKIQNKHLASRGKYLQLQVVKQQKEVDAARKDVEKAVIARNEAVKSVERLEKEIAQRQNELRQMKISSAKVAEELKVKSAKLTEAENSLKNIQNELVAAKKNLSLTQSTLHSAMSRLSDTQSKLIDTQAKLKKTEETVKEKEDIIAANQETIYKNDQIIRKQQDLMAKLLDESRRQDDMYVDLRSKTLIFRQGDEVVRGIIPAKQSKFLVRGIIYSLLDKASERAMNAGALTGSNGRSVKVVPSKSIKDPFAVEYNCIDYILEATKDSPYDWLVQFVCARNTIAGEQVPVEPRMCINKLVYKKGDFIASTKINGRLSEGRVMLSLLRFVQGDISKAGIQKNIIPVTNSMGSQEDLVQNPQRQLDDLLTVVDQIRSKSGQTMVDVYACKNIHVSDVLSMDNMRFSVTKIE